MCPFKVSCRVQAIPCKAAGRVGMEEVGYSKSLFPEKILLLYHSVDPTGSQTVSRVSPFLYNTALETRLTLGAVECHSAAG